jgi:hypothetical protein
MFEDLGKITFPSRDAEHGVCGTQLVRLQVVVLVVVDHRKLWSSGTALRDARIGEPLGTWRKHFL